MAYQPRIDNWDQVPMGPPATLLFSTYYGTEGGASVFDAAGNKFVVVQVNVPRSNDSFVYARKYNPQGQFVAHKRWPLYNFDKHDWVSVSHSGRDLVIIHGGHDTPNPVPEEGRENPTGETRWEGVYEPFPGMSTQQGGASVLPSEPEPNPDPVPTPSPTKEDYQDWMREVIGNTDGNPFTQHWGSHRSVRTGTMEKVQDALGAEQNEEVTQGGQRRRGHLLNFADKIVAAVLDKLTPGPKSSFEYFAQLINTSYQGTGVMLCETGLWDGILPNGQRMLHPLTRQPLSCPAAQAQETEEEPS